MSNIIHMIANWKLNGSKSLIGDYSKFTSNIDFKSKNINPILCVPFTHISLAKEYIKNCKIGAQDISSNVNGSYTGEVSGDMISDVGCEYVIIGHSERRKNHAESDDLIKLKIDQAIKSNIKPILCIGELEEERNSYKKVISNQLSLIDKSLDLIIAYEPRWAIGTGKTPTMNEIKDVANFIKKNFPQPIIYGGSANEENSESILSINEIQGLLIGGASLNPEKYLKMCGF